MSVMQDRKGYLWFGTGNGLDKYDGYQFTNYKFDPLDSTSLSKNQVLTLWEDKNGIIWIGTTEGTCKFDPRTEKFTRLGKSRDNPFAFNYAQSFSEDTDGNLWVGGSFAGQLRQIDRETGKFSSTNYADLLEPNKEKNTKNSERLYVIYKDKRGTLWIGSPTGLHRLNLTNQESGKPSKISFTHFRHDPTDPSSLSPKGVAGIYEDREGIFWVMTYSGILDALDPLSGKFTHYRPGYNKLFDVERLLGSKIGEDLEGNLWIGTIKALYKFDKERKEFTLFSHDPTDQETINNNSVYSLLVDRSGILWVTTPEGVNKADPRKKPFEMYRHNPFNLNSLSHNKVTSVCEDKEGGVWVGTMGGGLNAIDRKTGKFTHYRHEPNAINSLRSDTVSVILEDSDGNLWIANGEVISTFNRDKKSFRHYSLHHPFLANSGGLSIFTLYEDRQKIFWIGTNNGILSFDRKTGKTIHYPYDPDHPEGISDYWALSILEDSKGNLWIGPGSQALNRFNRDTGEFTHYRYDSRKPGSISSNTVPTIYEDSKGNLWFGTGEGGLCSYDYATETFTAYTSQHGLAGNAVFSILEDDAGNLWLGTDNGLSKFSPTKESFTNYAAADGLQSRLFTTLYTKGAAFKGKDGTLYFGGNNGLNAFNPAAIRANTYVPPVVITQFGLFHKPLAGKSETKEVELQYDQNFFSLEFAALSYTSTHKNQYAYKLEGVDKAWVQAGTRRLASYTDISPGKYVFKVKGSNNDGVWNEKGIDFTIIIHPPWWYSWWAYAFYGLCFLAFLFAIDRFQRRRLTQREREKTRERELEQAREIEKAYHELKQTQTQLVQKEKMASLGELTAGIAHEIQNPLNFINNFSEVSKELCHELKEELTIGHHGEATAIAVGLSQILEKIHHHGRRAESIVKGMLQHSRTSSGQKEPTDLNALANEYMRLAYHGLRAKDKNFTARLVTDLAPRLEKVEVVPQELGRVLLNLFNNAFYAVQQKQKLGLEKYDPEVRLSTRQRGGKVEVRVRDNGTGIPPKDRGKIFQPFFTTKPSGQGTGLGLSLSYDIITKGHGGELQVESNEGEYTEFIIYIPVPVASLV
jgi:signal transduction histidine kinase/ligand-binding sensor domain-containing protein